MYKKIATAGLTIATLAVSSLTASAATINLGFSLDESGSVGSVNFNTIRNALADALAVIPTSGPNQYRLGVTTYASGTTTVVAPVIVTAANIAGIQNSVRTTVFNGGGTNTAGAISNLQSLFNAHSTDTTLFNITTDGVPNSQIGAENAALAANTAYVDGISFEAVGSGINSASALANMARIAGLGTSGDATAGVVLADSNNIPNATTTGFVIPVLNFADYENAITAKIGKIVIDTGGGPNVVPLPAGLPLLLVGLGGFGILSRRKKKMAA